MKKYKFEATIGYELEAENEDDVIYQIADLLKNDWKYLIDEGEITELEA